MTSEKLVYYAHGNRAKVTDRLSRFQRLNFDKFRLLAKDASLSEYERIGFPEVYRKGLEGSIFQDICVKIPNLLLKQKTVLDIGPGASPLSRAIIDYCAARQHHLTLIDSPEVLDCLPSSNAVAKVPGRFPDDLSMWLTASAAKLDVIICYSVLHYVFEEGNIFSFLDNATSLLAKGGQMLLGDLPNVDRRKRFFASDAGINFHKNFMQTETPPITVFNVLEAGLIDDAIIGAIWARYRHAGYEVHIVEQDPSLPMANRREDIVIRRN